MCINSCFLSWIAFPAGPLAAPFGRKPNTSIVLGGATRFSRAVRQGRGEGQSIKLTPASATPRVAMRSGDVKRADGRREGCEN